MTIGFDLGHDLDLEFSRSNIEFAISQPKMVRLPWNEKQAYRLNSKASNVTIRFDLGHDHNTLRPRQNGCYFADGIFKCIFLNENAWISLKISLKFVPKVQINNIAALVQIMAWHRPGFKPLSEPMMVGLLTHICVTRPQRLPRKV